jgi:hypothetical protein
VAKDYKFILKGLTHRINADAWLQFELQDRKIFIQFELADMSLVMKLKQAI